MGLAIYVHIPYCLQRCRYCDFTTFEADQIMPPQKYLELIQAEIRNRHQHLKPRRLSSVYFGGGTPSLVPAEHIVAMLQELANAGFEFTTDTEVTVEINPATVDPKKLDAYLQHGVNRFSVGAQTFNDTLLNLCGRKHSADDTRATLRLLDQRDVNYSFDLLFALPGQTIADLKADLDEVARFRPRHLSAYCLTVPQGHPMETGRPLEDEQIAMFNLIERELKAMGIEKYEISNFAQPGFESRHNQTYWNDQPYWGLGLSAHSYLPIGPWGTRFWNPKTWPEYIHQAAQPFDHAEHLTDPLPPTQKERLAAHESLTDYCHMFLRTSRGLNLSALRKKYGPRADFLETRLKLLLRRGLLTHRGDIVSLSGEGQLLSNQVFAELLVTAEEWPLPSTPSLA
ncbi:MAG: radical SAM family heme chaperone HemW [Bdellovibrionales bacterium]